jgi:thiosulfate/3-mercaptopyruvate sulfurtransferase
MNRSYPGAEFLAEPEWLQRHLKDEPLCIIDARFDVRLNSDGQFEEVPGLVDYTKAHIPGALFVDLYNDLADPETPTSIINAAAFEALMQRLSVGRDTTIVIYDDRGGVWAARLWWALRYYGHTKVKMLNGGLTAWRKAGYMLESGSQSASKTAKPTQPFKASINPSMRVEKQDVLAATASPKIRLIDALPAPIYQGYVGLYPRHRKGHIPSAHNIPAQDNLDPETQRLLPLDALTALWASAEIAPDQPVITYCGGGIFASFALFVLAVMGHEQTALYDASWMEWGRDESLPVATD